MFQEVNCNNCGGNLFKTIKWQPERVDVCVVCGLEKFAQDAIGENGETKNE